MEYKLLGQTQLKVSQICLGTMTWGDQNSREDGFAQMDYALENGINFFDTAELYPVPPKKETYTRTESIIGDWFFQNKKRNSVILATKIAGPSKNLPWIRGEEADLDGENLEKALEGSLRRLKTDFIDLYQLHWPSRKTNYFGKLGYVHSQNDTSVPMAKTLETLGKFIKNGKIRYYGLSNETPWGIFNCIQQARALNLPPPVSVQNPYSLLNRTYEVGAAEVSHRENIGLLAYSPLGFGVLSGKYLKGQKPLGSRLERFGGHFTRYNSNNSTSATARYFKLAKKHGLTGAQMALAFVNSRSFLTSNIIGATNMEQLRENIQSIDIQLSGEVLEEIEKIHTALPNPAP